MPNPSSPQKISPLTSLMDTRSQPDDMQPGTVRARFNFQAFSERTLRRGGGWSKLLTGPNYNNADFHDQLLSISGSAREPITLQSSVQASDGARYLFIGTQSRLFRLNAFTGNYVLIGGGYGGGHGTDCVGPRFQISVLGDYAIITNGFDAPFYHVVDQYPNLDGAVVNPITDLTVINLSTAKKTWVWRNCIFLASVVMDGVKLPHRFVWSDYNSPLSFDPAVQGSIAGYQDLDFGEEILAGAEFGNSFLIYTNRSIWEMYVNSSGVFAVRKCIGVNSQNAMRYENTLVNCGEFHAYMGKDRIYLFNQFMSQPDEAEWLHLADNPIYSNIDDTACAAHVGAFINNEVYYSVKTNASTNECPDITLRFHKIYKCPDIIDHGFTTLVPFRPMTIPSIRDMIIDQKICTQAAMASAGYGWKNEGLPNPSTVPTGSFSPTCIYTHASKVTSIGITIEDTSQPTSAPDSICALMATDGYQTPQSFCQECEAELILIGASSDDWCLKQFDGVTYRERCSNFTAVGSQQELGYQSSVGAYVQDGYDSYIIFAPLWAENMSMELSRILFNYIALKQSAPASIALSVGVSGQVADANTDNCPIKWNKFSSKPMTCMTNQITTQTSPSADLQWKLFIAGKFLHVKLDIGGTGGDCLLSGIQGDIAGEVVRNY